MLMDEILTTKMASAYIKKPKSWIREHAKELGGRKFGREYRFERDKILQWFHQLPGEQNKVPLDEVRFVRAG